MNKKAVDYYKSGSSCSESIVQAAIDIGLCDKSLLAVSSVFSGGMSSGCLCGAIAGAQIVLGANYGKNNSQNNEEIARLKAKKFIEEFKKNHRATCCKVLTAGLSIETGERKRNCTSLVDECAKILESMVNIKASAV